MRYFFWILCVSASLLATSFAYGQDTQILINHVGYEADGPKKAVISAHQEKDISTFEVLSAETDSVVFTAEPEFKGPVAEWKDWKFWTLQFSDFSDEGEYYIRATTDDVPLTSYIFKIKENLLEQFTLSDVIFYFKAKRSSGQYDKADHNLPFEGNREGTVDAHGGWFDATGDYGKHLSHLSFSNYFNPQQLPLVVWSLFQTYEELTDRDNPQFRQYKRRLLAEAFYGADYLKRIKTSDGSFYRSVSAPGAEKKPEDRVIAAESGHFTIASSEDREDQKTDKRSIENAAAYEVSFRSGGGISIAGLAMASQFDISGDYENSAYLQAAEEAFEFLEKNNAEMTFNGQENIIDDYCALLAAVELYKATEKEQYRKAADERAKSLMDRLISSEEYQNYWRADDGDRPYFHPADAGMPVISLLEYLEIADSSAKDDILATVKNALQFELAITEEVTNPFGYSRQLVQDTTGYRRTSFFFPHNAETSPWWQGENARLSSVAAAARQASKHFKEDKTFYNNLQRYAQNQLDWILGLNPYNASMLEGSGHNNPRYLFFNSYEYTNAPGGIVNGITSGLDNDKEIAFNIGYNVTGKDYDWRWTEQWLPHASWYLYAISIEP